jgi:hypothetical protein
MFRPLHPGLHLPREFGTPALICLEHCKRSLEGCERYWAGSRQSGYSVFNLYVVYNCVITLVFLLPDVRSHDLFLRACGLLHRHAHDFQFAGLVLQFLQMIVEILRLPVPHSVAPLLSEWNMATEDLVDVPISFVLPARHEILEFLADEDEVSQSNGLELGKLMSKWAALETAA